MLLTVEYFDDVVVLVLCTVPETGIDDVLDKNDEDLRILVVTCVPDEL